MLNKKKRNLTAIVLAVFWHAASCDQIENTAEGGTIHARAYLIVSGIVFLILACCITICQLNRKEVVACMANIIGEGCSNVIICIFGGTIGAFNLVVGVVGLSVHSDYSDECKSTHEGKMVLWYGILKVVFGTLEMF